MKKILFTIIAVFALIIPSYAATYSASKQAPVVSETVPGEGAAGAYHDEYHVDEQALQKQIIDLFYVEN